MDGQFISKVGVETTSFESRFSKIYFHLENLTSLFSPMKKRTAICVQQFVSRAIACEVIKSTHGICLCTWYTAVSAP